VIVVHENGHWRPCEWAVLDVYHTLRERGVDVRTTHNVLSEMAPDYYRKPLETLYYEEGCELFLKADTDDIFYSCHISRMRDLMLDKHDKRNEYDYALNTDSEVVVLANKGEYLYNPRVDFGIWNPTGANTNAIIFNRAVAAHYIAMLRASPGIPDDVTIAQKVLPHFKGLRVSDHPTLCYVSHGKNISTPRWADHPPPEVN
jgi:hypothetical protein